MNNEEKIEEKKFCILAYNEQINKYFVCVVKATSDHHACNLVYSRTSLKPIREATEGDYDIVADATSHTPTLSIWEGLPACTLIITK